MSWGLTQVTPPTGDTLLIGEACAWLRLDSADEEPIVLSLIAAARRMIEKRTNRALLTSGWRLTLDGFPVSEPIKLLRGPVTAVTAVGYVDTAGAGQVVPSSDYIVDLTREPVRIVPAFNKAWPSVRAQIAAVTVDFTAGYASAAAIPDELKLAMRLLVAHWFENREAVVVGTINSRLEMAFDALVEPYRLWTFQ